MIGAVQSRQTRTRRGRFARACLDLRDRRRPHIEALEDRRLLAVVTSPVGFMGVEQILGLAVMAEGSILADITGTLLGSSFALNPNPQLDEFDLNPDTLLLATRPESLEAPAPGAGTLVDYDNVTGQVHEIRNLDLDLWNGADVNVTFDSFALESLLNGAIPLSVLSAISVDVLGMRLLQDDAVLAPVEPGTSEVTIEATLELSVDLILDTSPLGSTVIAPGLTLTAPVSINATLFTEPVSGGLFRLILDGTSTVNFPFSDSSPLDVNEPGLAVLTGSVAYSADVNAELTMHLEALIAAEANLPALTTTPSVDGVLNFGHVLVGTAQNAIWTASNSGAAGSQLNGTFPNASGEFSPGSTLAFGPLDAGASANRNYTYTPNSRGEDSLLRTITSDGGSSTVTFAGRGVAPLGAASGAGVSSPGAFTLVGTTGQAITLVMNNGDGNLSGLGAISNLNGTLSSGAGEFALVGSPSVSIPDGTSINPVYDYAPTTRGVDVENLIHTFTNGNPAGNNTAHNQVVTVSGQGVAPLQLTSHLDSPLARVGTSTVARIDVENIGDGNLSGLGAISNLNGSIDGGTSPQFIGGSDSFSLPDTVSAPFPIDFTPIFHGVATSTFTLAYTNGSDDGSNLGQIVPVLITGQGVGPVFDALPYDRSGVPAPGGTLDFGSVLIGADIDLQLDISNITADPNGGDTTLTDLTLLSVEIVGPDAGDFELLGFTPGTVVSAAETLPFQVRFTPSGSGSPKSATLTFLTDQEAVFGAAGITVDLLLVGFASEGSAAGISVFADGLVTRERGDAATFQVVLDAAPTSEVRIAVSSSDPTEGTVEPQELVFTPGDWDTPKTVTVHGVPDGVPDGDQPYLVQFAPATSDDPRYAGLQPEPLEASNLDGDFVWSNPAGGLFSVGSNWESGIAPGADDTAVFSLDASYTVTFDDHVTNSRLLVHRGDVQFDLEGFTYTVTNASESSPSAAIGVDASDDARLRLTDGGFDTQTLVVGRSGTGRLDIEQNTLLRSTLGIVAQEPGSFGTVEFASTTISRWDVTSALLVGLGGSGALRSLDGGTIESPWIGAGLEQGASGEIELAASRTIMTVTALVSPAADASGELHIGGFDGLDLGDLGGRLGGVGGTGLVSAAEFARVEVARLAHVWEQGTLDASDSGLVSIGESRGLDASLALQIPLLQFVAASRGANFDVRSTTLLPRAADGTFPVVDTASYFVGGQIDFAFQLLEDTVPLNGIFENVSSQSGLVTVEGDRLKLVLPFLGTDTFVQAALPGEFAVDGQIVAYAHAPMADPQNVAGRFTFEIDPDQTLLELSGSLGGFPFEEQLPGSLLTNFTGYFVVDLAPGTIDLPGGGLVEAVERPGPFLPGVAFAEGTVQVWTQARLQGAGRVVGDVINAGVVGIGPEGGNLEIQGHYEQDRFGRLDIALRGTGNGQFDRLDVSGAVTLDGELRLFEDDGFSVAAGQRFDPVVTYATRDGAFSSIVGEDFPNGLVARADYGSTSLAVELVEPRIVVEADGLVTSETGQTAVFTVALSVRPEANVTLNIASDDASEGFVSPNSIVFRPEDWSPTQKIAVTVTGLPDNLADGDIQYHVLFGPAICEDEAYAGQRPDALPVVNLDVAEFPAITVDDVAVVEGDSGSTPLVFAVRLSAPSSQLVRVHFTTEAATAEENSDFVPTIGILEFQPGETEREVPVDVLGERVYEDDETFLLRLSDAEGAELVDEVALGTILADDGPPLLATTPEDGSTIDFHYVLVDQVGKAEVHVINVGDGGPLAGMFPMAGGDFIDPPGQAFELLPDESTSRPYQYRPTERGADQATIHFVTNGGEAELVLQGVGVAPVSSVVDGPTALVLVRTDGIAVVLVSNLGDGNLSSLGTSSNLRGSIPQDAGPFTIVGSREISLPDGALREVEYAITPMSRGLQEAEVAFSFNNGSPDHRNDRHTLAATVSAQGVAPVLSASHVDATFVRVGTTRSDAARVEVENIGDGNLSGLGAPSNLNGSIDGGTNAQFTGGATDFSLVDMALREILIDFAPTARGPASSTFTLHFANGSEDGRNEAQDVAFDIAGQGVGPEFHARAFDLAGAPTPDELLDFGGVSIGSQAELRLDLSNTSTDPNGGDASLTDLTLLSVEIVGADAASFEIIEFTPGMVVAAGESLPFQIRFHATGPAGAKSATLLVVTDVGAALGAEGESFEISLLGEVIDDSPPPALAIEGVALAEGNAGARPFLFVVRLSAPSAQTVRVHYATVDGTAQAGSDYRATAGTLEFRPGETQATIPVEVLGDLVFELDEDFLVELSEPEGATLAGAAAVGTILADDPLPTVSIGAATLEEGDLDLEFREVVFQVTLSHPSEHEIRVDVATADGTAQGEVDFVHKQETLIFAPGEIIKSVAVRVIGETRFEADETFRLETRRVEGALAPSTPGLGTIVNDDATLSGSVYLDLDYDGVRTSADRGLPGVRVLLSGKANFGASISRETFTDADGVYRFADLPTGSYLVTQVRSGEFFDSADSSRGTPIVVLRGSNQFSVDLPAGETSGLDFAELYSDLGPPPPPSVPPLVPPTQSPVILPRVLPISGSPFSVPLERDPLNVMTNLTGGAVEPPRVATAEQMAGGLAVSSDGAVIQVVTPSVADSRVAQLIFFVPIDETDTAREKPETKGVIAGVVFEDRDGDGIRIAEGPDPDPIFPDVVVQLDRNHDGTFDESETYRTDENGYFEFGDLEGGETYRIRVVPPEDWAVELPKQWQVAQEAETANPNEGTIEIGRQGQVAEDVALQAKFTPPVPVPEPEVTPWWRVAVPIAVGVGAAGLVVRWTWGRLGQRGTIGGFWRKWPTRKQSPVTKASRRTP